MRVCVVGSGGREHALADVLGRTADVVVTPGNPGIAADASLPYFREFLAREALRHARPTASSGDAAAAVPKAN